MLKEYLIWCSIIAFLYVKGNVSFIYIFFFFESYKFIALFSTLYCSQYEKLSEISKNYRIFYKLLFISTLYNISHISIAMQNNFYLCGEWTFLFPFHKVSSSIFKWKYIFARERVIIFDICSLEREFSIRENIASVNTNRVNAVGTGIASNVCTNSSSFRLWAVRYVYWIRLRQNTFFTQFFSTEFN